MTGRWYISSLLLTLILSSLVVISSCSVGEYLNAYFNTYYNASRLFAEAEEELLAQPPTKGPDTTFLPPYRIQASTKSKLTSVVEKCSKILQYNAESSLVDDALLMIGQSYYYQNELQRAERKFGELISGYPESDLVPRAEILLVQTYYRMDDKEKALTAAQLIADSTGGDHEGISALAFMVIGQIRSERGDYGGARRAYGYAAEYGDEPSVRAQAYMRVAGMSERLGELDDALSAYEDAEDESRSYDRQFQARMGQVTILTRKEEYGTALNRLDDIRANANFREYFADVDLAIARTLEAEGEIDDAVDQYYYVDTTYARTPSSAQSHLSLGRLYESVLNNYDSAYAVYTRGRTQSPQDPATAVMIRRADYLRRYRTYSQEVARLESLKVEILSPVRGEKPPAEVSADSSADSTITRVTPPLPSIDSVETALARNKADLGGLFYIGFELEDSSRYWYERVLRDHPGNQFSARALYTLAQIGESQGDPRQRIDSLYDVIISDYPQTVFADEARRIRGRAEAEQTLDPAVPLYDEGESLLLQGNREEAINRFRQIVHDYPKSDLAPKAQYAIAWVYDDGALSDSAITNFRKLVQLYPASAYSTEAFTRLRDVPPEVIQRLEKGIPAEGASVDSTVIPPEPMPESSDSTAETGEAPVEEEG